MLGGLQLSDDDPANVGDTADDGDATEASKANHAHRVPIDNTLEFNAMDELAVNVQDVIEHTASAHPVPHGIEQLFQHRRGATVGQIYQTPANTASSVTKVEVLLNPLVGADGYLVRLDEVERRQLHQSEAVHVSTPGVPPLVWV